LTPAARTADTIELEERGVIAYGPARGVIVAWIVYENPIQGCVEARRQAGGFEIPAWIRFGISPDSAI
jgi:hypothetical protein